MMKISTTINENKRKKGTKTHAFTRVRKLWLKDSGRFVSHRRIILGMPDRTKTQQKKKTKAFSKTYSTPKDKWGAHLARGLGRSHRLSSVLVNEFYLTHRGAEVVLVNYDLPGIRINPFLRVRFQSARKKRHRAFFFGACDSRLLFWLWLFVYIRRAAMLFVRLVELDESKKKGLSRQ